MALICYLAFKVLHCIFLILNTSSVDAFSAAGFGRWPFFFGPPLFSFRPGLYGDITGF